MCSDPRSETEEREAVVQAAWGWLGTPYHPCGRVRGVNGGADCLTVVVGAYEEAGLIPPQEIEAYSQEWHLHRNEEKYLNGVLQYARQLPAGELPKPGDLVLWKFGRCFSHGAIVVKWPRIIHAYMGRNCTLENAETSRWLTTIGEGSGEQVGRVRPRKFFTLWPRG